MLAPAQITTLFDSELFTAEYQQEDHGENPAALPDASLRFLLRLAAEIQPTRIFEFGSGRSTIAFLEAGYEVTSLEDSSYWMEQTRAAIPEPLRARHTALVEPLQLHFHSLIPMKDWRIGAAVRAKLETADLILVDSPYFTPFRESTLCAALRHGHGAVVVLDDTRIPTVARFCESLARQNAPLLRRRVPVGHHFDVFWLPPGQPLRNSHSLVETLKGWRRYFCADKLLQPQP